MERGTHLEQARPPLPKTDLTPLALGRFLRDQELHEIDDLVGAFHAVVVDAVLAVHHERRLTDVPQVRKPLTGVAIPLTKRCHLRLRDRWPNMFGRMPSPE